MYASLPLLLFFHIAVPRHHPVTAVSQSPSLPVARLAAVLIVRAQNWSCIEYSVGIMCASLPILNALLRRMFPGFCLPMGPSNSCRRRRRDCQNDTSYHHRQASLVIPLPCHGYGHGRGGGAGRAAHRNQCLLKCLEATILQENGLHMKQEQQQVQRVVPAMATSATSTTTMTMASMTMTTVVGTTGSVATDGGSEESIV